MNDLYINRNIIAIDLKSFFASCECIDRGLDPFTTPLVVCNPKQKGAITLAVTPYLKQFGFLVDAEFMILISISFLEEQLL